MAQLIVQAGSGDIDPLQPCVSSSENVKNQDDIAPPDPPNPPSLAVYITEAQRDRDKKTAIINFLAERLKQLINNHLLSAPRLVGSSAIPSSLIQI
jgi:hypothetical protein